MLREGLQVPVGGRRCLREAIVNLVGYPTALLILDRDNPTDHTVQLALAFGKVLVEAEQLLLVPLALGEVAPNVHVAGDLTLLPSQGDGDPFDPDRRAVLGIRDHFDTEPTRFS